MRLDDVVDRADIIIMTTGNKDIVTADHMARMKHQTILANVGHFDNEIDMAGFGLYPGIHRINIKPQVDEWIFLDGHNDRRAVRGAPTKPWATPPATPRS